MFNLSISIHKVSADKCQISVFANISVINASYRRLAFQLQIPTIGKGPGLLLRITVLKTLYNIQLLLGGNTSLTENFFISSNSRKSRGNSPGFIPGFFGPGCGDGLGAGGKREKKFVRNFHEY